MPKNWTSRFPSPILQAILGIETAVSDFASKNWSKQLIGICARRKLEISNLGFWVRGKSGNTGLFQRIHFRVFEIRRPVRMFRPLRGPCVNHKCYKYVRISRCLRSNWQFIGICPCLCSIVSDEYLHLMVLFQAHREKQCGIKPPPAQQQAPRTGRSAGGDLCLLPARPTF